MPYGKIEIKREPDTEIFSVFVDGKKIGEHLTFTETIELTNMVENGEVNG